MAPIPKHLLPDGAKGLVFDCDGTLLDSMPQHLAAWVATCKHFGLKMTAKDLVRMAGKPVAEILDIVCAEQNVQVDRDAFAAMKSKYYLDHDTEVAIIEPVMQIVREGHARGLPMAVASGGTREHVMRGLESSGILPFFQAVVTAEDVKHGKPAPDVFLRAAELITIPAADCVGYEDAELGMQSIRNAGFLSAVDVTVLEGYPMLTDA